SEEADEPAAISEEHLRASARTFAASTAASRVQHGAASALHHLEAFSVVESWSGYFHPTDPLGRRVLDLGSPSANANASAHAFVGKLRRGFARRPTFFAFYVGRGDARFRAENRLFHRELTTARVPHVFRIYAGGHEQAVWTAHAKAWLAGPVDHLARPRQPAR